MKKLLSLAVLACGIFLFAGCMNTPAETEEETTPVVEETTGTTTTEEVVPEVIAE